MRFADDQPEAAGRVAEVAGDGRGGSSSPEAARQMEISKAPTDEKSFRWLLNEEAMATEKLSEGIRLFAADSAKLDKRIAEMLETGK